MDSRRVSGYGGSCKCEEARNPRQPAPKPGLERGVALSGVLHAHQDHVRKGSEFSQVFRRARCPLSGGLVPSIRRPQKNARINADRPGSAKYRVDSDLREDSFKDRD